MRSTNKCLPFFNFLKGNKKFEWDENCSKAFDQLKSYLSSLPIISKPKDEEQLFVYLVVSNHVVSAVFIREKDKMQKPMYYISKMLLDTKGTQY